MTLEQAAIIVGFVSMAGGFVWWIVRQAYKEGQKDKRLDNVESDLNALGDKVRSMHGELLNELKKAHSELLERVELLTNRVAENFVTAARFDDHSADCKQDRRNLWNRVDDLERRKADK